MIYGPNGEFRRFRAHVRWRSDIVPFFFFTLQYFYYNKSRQKVWQSRDNAPHLDDC
jgi:hypothetical protein